MIEIFRFEDFFYQLNFQKLLKLKYIQDEYFPS